MERLKRMGCGVNFKADACAEGESSALKLFLAVSHSFYVFPGLRNRNLSHIPVRRENLLDQTGGFRTVYGARRLLHKSRFLSFKKFFNFSLTKY